MPKGLHNEVTIHCFQLFSRVYSNWLAFLMFTVCIGGANE